MNVQFKGILPSNKQYRLKLFCSQFRNSVVSLMVWRMGGGDTYSYALIPIHLFSLNQSMHATVSWNVLIHRRIDPQEANIFASTNESSSVHNLKQF